MSARLLPDFPTLVSGLPDNKPARWNLPDAIGTDEWMQARSAPDCIVTDYLYADVGVLVAAGGVGKTTLQLFEAVHIVLGRPLHGLEVRKPGPVLILTAEDSREMLVARLRVICADMRLSDDELLRVRERVRISDVSGNGLRLTEVVADVVVTSESIDDLVRGCQKLAPVLIVIDPAVSFGVGESRVNDAEQGLIAAGRKLRNALNCCVRYIHHTGKANSRDKALDQYAGRGGSAFADGSRMVHVLQPLTPDEWRTATGQTLEPGEKALMLARPKMSYSPPQGALYIKRVGFRYEVVETAAQDCESVLRSRGNHLLEILVDEIAKGHFPTQRNLEATKVGMSRQALRSTLAWLQSTEQIEEAQRDGVNRGARTYLRPMRAGAATAHRAENEAGEQDYCATQDDDFSLRQPEENQETAHRDAPVLASLSLGAPAPNGAPTAQRRTEAEECGEREVSQWL